MPEVDLAALADAGAFVSHEHQAHLAEVVRIVDWRIDATGSALEFTDAAGSERSVRAHFLGTSSPDDGTWLWAWQNINGFPGAFVKQSERVRALGQRYAIPEFTSAALPLDEALPATLLRAVKAVTGITAHFSAPTGTGGTRAWVLLDDPSLALPPPTVARAVAVVTSALASGGPSDHRRALTAWTRQRGVQCTEAGDDVAELALTDGSLRVRFDGAGRITGLGKRPRTVPEQGTALAPGERPAAPVVGEEERLPALDGQPIVAPRHGLLRLLRLLGRGAGPTSPARSGGSASR